MQYIRGTRPHLNNFNPLKVRYLAQTEEKSEIVKERYVCTVHTYQKDFYAAFLCLTFIETDSRSNGKLTCDAATVLLHCLKAFIIE